MLDYSQWHLHISVGYGVTQFMRAENRHMYNDFHPDGFHTLQTRLDPNASEILSMHRTTMQLLAKTQPTFFLRMQN